MAEEEGAEGPEDERIADRRGRLADDGTETARFLSGSSWRSTAFFGRSRVSVLATASAVRTTALSFPLCVPCSEMGGENLHSPRSVARLGPMTAESKWQMQQGRGMGESSWPEGCQAGVGSGRQRLTSVGKTCNPVIGSSSLISTASLLSALRSLTSNVPFGCDQLVCPN